MDKSTGRHGIGHARRRHPVDELPASSYVFVRVPVARLAMVSIVLMFAATVAVFLKYGTGDTEWDSAP